MMHSIKLPEVWLRGTIENIPALLQPVAHALLQAREEINKLLHNFPEYKMWDKPAGVASVAFHLQHLTGVLDRLFTYARSEQLTEAQLNFLYDEGKQTDDISLNILLENFNKQVVGLLFSCSRTYHAPYRSIIGYSKIFNRLIKQQLIISNKRSRSYKGQKKLIT